MIQESADSLKVDLSADELALFAENHELTSEHLEVTKELFNYLAKKKHDKTVETLLKQSRLPDKQPKTFENFDFTNLHGKQVERLKSLQTLSAIYSRKNLAFIGPQGVGKTHLAMAFGHECCRQEMKAYFLKASELNQKFTEARKHGREGAVVEGLVIPSCLIIDEIGHCVFDRGTFSCSSMSLTVDTLRTGLTLLFLQATNPHTSGKSFSLKTMICSMHWTGHLMMPQC